MSACPVGGEHDIDIVHEPPDGRVRWCWKCGKTWEVDEFDTLLRRHPELSAPESLAGQIAVLRAAFAELHATVERVFASIRRSFET